MSASPVAIGSTIAGKYRVERVLGQGGMGVVVVAMHDELDQRVAIKFLLKDALTDADWVARFAREARAATRIKSEHAVKVYDVGKLDTGAPYMVMEYLEGCDLQSILNERQRIPTSEAVEYLLQACEAIAEAHGAGVVHRDLKPANLFVTHRTDGSACVKILDFGISKMTSLTGGRDHTVTNTSAIVGSPLYMSPEQMKASKNVDRRTDIWSIGVILQELVSGVPSFVANTTAELCALVLTAPPTPLSETMPDAPAGLAAVIDRCLRKSPDERYATVAELAQALEPFGPSSVKTSVERIVRLTGGSRAGSHSGVEPPPVSIVPVGQRAQDVSSLGQTEMSDSGALAVVGPSPTTSASVGAASVAVVPPQQAGSGTAAAWGSSRTSPKRSRLPLMVGGGAAAALAVLGVVFLALKSSPETRPQTDPSKPTPTTMMTAAAAVTVVTTTTASAAVAATEAPIIVPTATTAHATTKPTSTVKAVSSAFVAGSAKKPTATPVDTASFGGRN